MAQKIILRLALMFLVPLIGRLFRSGGRKLGFRSDIPAAPDHDVGARPLKSSLPSRPEPGG